MKKRVRVLVRMGMAMLLLGGARERVAAQQPVDWLQYRNETQQLVRDGRHQEALERTLWYHHNSTRDPSQGGVRTSFALRDWQGLASVYKPALDSLIASRRESERQLFANPAERRWFIEVRAFDRLFGEEVRTLEIFDRLAAEHPEAARAQWPVVVEMAVGAKRLDLLRTYLPNLVEEFERQKEMHARLTQSSAARDARLKASVDERLVTQSLLLIDAAVALGDLQMARIIQQRALEVVDHDRLRTILPPG